MIRMCVDGHVSHGDRTCPQCANQGHNFNAYGTIEEIDRSIEIWDRHHGNTPGRNVQSQRLEALKKRFPLSEEGT